MEKYNKLTLLYFTTPIKRKGNGVRLMAMFKCDCGNESIKDYYAVKTGHTKQCIKCGYLVTKKLNTKHGNVNHKLYRKWQDMLNRCRNKNVDRFKHYGGRGIKVCEDWELNFGSFLNWCLENGWKDGLQIDRIDVNGNYEPSNCRIVGPKEQGFNKQNTFYIEFNGKKYSLAKICYEQKLNYHTIYVGLKKGKTFQYYIEKYGIKI